MGIVGQCISDRVLKSSFELLAGHNTTNEPSNNNDIMTTTDNDDKTKARRATAPCMVLDHLLPAATNRRAIQDPQVGKEAAGIPSGVGRPGPGTDITPWRPASQVYCRQMPASCTGL